VSNTTSREDPLEERKRGRVRVVEVGGEEKERVRPRAFLVSGSRVPGMKVEFNHDIPPSTSFCYLCLLLLSFDSPIRFDRLWSCYYEYLGLQLKRALHSVSKTVWAMVPAGWFITQINPD
jgi:hypothetical protein